MEYAEHEIALSKAKIQLMSRPNSAFFTTLCFSLIHMFDENIPTACTNGKRVRYNPKYFLEQDPEARVSLLLHETLHCAYFHMGRLMGKDMMRWNIACDYVINLQLHERGYPIPDTWYMDVQYANMSAEEVYDLLPDNPKQSNMADLEEPEGDPVEVAKNIQDMIVRASLQSRMSGDTPGTIPGDIEIFLNKLLNPKLPWNRILQKYLQSFAKNDYSFRKPNRRFFPKHHLPSLYSNNLINIAIAVDTSGSVSDTDFLRFVSETHSILRMMKPEKIHLVQFDTQIKSVDVIKNVNDLQQTTFTGRGATNIDPVLKWANENKPQLLLVFTDGYYNSPKQTTKVDTIFLIHQNPGFTSPFGKVIHYEI